MLQVECPKISRCEVATQQTPSTVQKLESESKKNHQHKETNLSSLYFTAKE